MNIIAMVIAALIVLGSTAARSQEATSPTWPQVQSACGGEYRAAKGDASRPSWSEYLSECKTRKGFVPKRGARTAVTLPDVVK